MSTLQKHTRYLLAYEISKLKEEIDSKRENLKHECYQEYAEFTEIKIQSIQVQIEFLKKALIED
jgi:hypothetical protein